MESTKDGKKVDVLCIVDQNYEWSVVALDHLDDSGIQHRKWGGNTYPGKRKLLFEI